MYIRSKFCGQSIIEYLLLVTAIAVVLITGILAKRSDGKSFFAAKVEDTIGHVNVSLNAMKKELRFGGVSF